MTALTQEKSISRVLHALKTIKNKGMVIMVDEEDRENEGDLVFAAEHVTPEKINFMSRHGCGLICLSLDGDFIDRLRLPMMIDANKQRDAKGTAFTVSIEAKHGVTTGISAADRSHTIRVAVDDKTTPEDLVVPGHIFPLRSKSGGVLERAGHTEGSVDIAKLAGCKGAAVICEIMNKDGSMARLPELEAMAKEFDLPLVTIPDLISYRLLRESLVEIELRKPVLTSQGTFEGVLFRSKLDSMRHFALVNTTDFENKIVDVRVHVQRTLVDIFGHHENGGRLRIEYGLKLLRESPNAALVYMSQPQSQENFINEIEELFGDTQTGEKAKLAPGVMDNRLIGTGAQILRALGISKMRVHSTANQPYLNLSGFGLEIFETVSMRSEQ